VNCLDIDATLNAVAGVIGIAQLYIKKSRPGPGQVGLRRY
jgi:hypothetical protein